MLNIILSIAMFTGFVLQFGAWKRWQRDGAGQQVWLMVVAALVIFANIAIWVAPDEKGKSLASESKSSN